KEPLAAADVWMKPRLVSAGGVTLYNPAYSLARMNDSVVELGCLPLFEPSIDGAYAGLRLEIWGRKTSGSLETGLDYLMLAPPDGYRRYNPLPNADWSGASLVDCGQPQAYAQDAGGNLLPAFLAAGDPLQLVPGRGSCLTFQLSGSAGAAIQRQLSLRAWLRPRKRRL
ncbi:MAG TPA: hypothetical protein VHO48_00395, partial [Anaerolineaceae bacterium]|nr:hypothetical protein [Anaerolineaceae bacterium]